MILNYHLYEDYAHIHYHTGEESFDSKLSPIFDSKLLLYHLYRSPVQVRNPLILKESYHLTGEESFDSKLSTGQESFDSKLSPHYEDKIRSNIITCTGEESFDSKLSPIQVRNPLILN